MDTAQLDLILPFLAGIGLPAREAALGEDCFLPGVTVHRGELRYDPRRLAWPADLLHEAGHLAVTPAAQRASMDGTLGAEELEPHGGEAEAIAWSFAAAAHLGLPPDCLFHAGGYKGSAQGLIFTYMLGVYPGSFGLAQAGLAAIGAQAAELGVKPYPHMLRWLRA